MSLLNLSVTLTLIATCFGYGASPYNRLTSVVHTIGKTFQFMDLKPDKNPNPVAEPQPKALRPEFIKSLPNLKKAWITLTGTVNDPGNEVAVLDLESLTIMKRIRVGLRPIHIEAHPSGKWVIVTNEYSNYFSVIDTELDKVVSRIPSDFYCQSLLIHPDGQKGWASNRYLSQILPVHLKMVGTILTGKVQFLNGFLLNEFTASGPSPHQILRARCQKCHYQPAGDFMVNENSLSSFLSLVDNAVPGDPEKSRILRAVLGSEEGGFGEPGTGQEFHAGGVILSKTDQDYISLSQFISKARPGPGITVGNAQSMPRHMVLLGDGYRILTGNTGTNDISLVDTRLKADLGGIYLQGLVHSLILLNHKASQKQRLLVLGLGAGFGAPKSRDPLGAETWDKTSETAHFTVLRSAKDSDTLTLQKQFVMGPFDAVDGTWNFKMRDIQNDLTVIHLDKVSLPRLPKRPLPYFLMANQYGDNEQYVRYTSDTAEATLGDIKADYPPELQRVHGSFPDFALQIDDRLYVTMMSSFEVVEYQIHWDADEDYRFLEPTRVYPTGLLPKGLALGLGKTLLTINSFEDSLQVIDLVSHTSITLEIFTDGQLATTTDAGKGDLIFRSSKLTSDGDTSCFHCHYRDTGDGRGWGAAEAIAQDNFGHIQSGGTLGIPQVRNLYGNEPFYFEGTHYFSEGQGADINEPASSIDFDKAVVGGDYTHIYHPLDAKNRPLMHEELKERVEVSKLGDKWWDLEERRNTFLKEKAREIFGKEYGLRDLYRFMGTYMGNNSYLPPNPYDTSQATFKRGEKLFFSAQVMCAVCHVPPNFTSKSQLLADNARRALPQLTTMTRRDASYTLVSVNALERINGRTTDMGATDPGRIEDIEGSFTTMQLRGIFDRPPVFLHHGRARSLREVLLTPGHPGAKDYRYPVLSGSENIRPSGKEIGLNETTLRGQEGSLARETQVIDTHGGTSHLNSRQIEDLHNFMLGIP